MNTTPVPLSVTNHDRDAVGLTYVYPVLSRRAGGISLGINLNVNNACNWRCVYCQVPDLKRGGPPPVDLARLRAELDGMLADIVQGDYLARHAPEGLRRLNDIALSGNGEPTSAPEFPAVIDQIGEMLDKYQLAGKLKLVLISNGSLMRKAYVQDGLRRMAHLGGEVWFKLDRASQAGMRTVNGTQASLARHLDNLRAAAALCPTWLQTCLFASDGAPPPDSELDAYLDLLRSLRAEGTPVRGVLLYGLARPPMLPGGQRLGRVDEAWLGAVARRIEALGLTCKVAP